MHGNYGYVGRAGAVARARCRVRRVASAVGSIPRHRPALRLIRHVISIVRHSLSEVLSAVSAV